MNQKLITLRLNAGLSMRQAALSIGIARDTYEGAEKNGMPHPATAKKIADFYGVRVTDLWTTDGEPTEVAA